MSRKNFLRDLRTFPQIFLRLNPQTFSLLECMLELLIDKSFCRKTVKLEWDVAFHWHDGRKWLVFAPVNNERAQLGQLSGHTNYLSYVPSPFSRALSLRVRFWKQQDFPFPQYLQGGDWKENEGWMDKSCRMTTGRPNYWDPHVQHTM